jgi:NADH-quinone oxidoreductase E subunit
VIYALFMVQQKVGWVTRAGMRHVAEVLGCTTAEVEDVATYYAMFYKQPVGKYVVQVCRTLSCALKGAERVTEEIAHHLHIAPGETDPTGTFTLIEVECLGACDRAPVVMVNDGWHECLQPEDAVKLLDVVKTKGEAALSGCVHRVEK